jgi:hypothetical protein
MRSLRSLAIVVCSLALLGCPPEGVGPFKFAAPVEDQLSLAGPVQVLLKGPPGLLKSKASLVAVTLDGSDVTGEFSGLEATLVAPPGEHELVATFAVMGAEVQTTRRFETILVVEPGACDGLSDAECWALNAAVADECEIFNRVECLLPYPSSRLTAPAATPTGQRLDLPQRGMPEVVGTPVPASLINDTVDGFSPTVQILTHFPQGVDVVASGLARLRPPCLDPAPPDEDPECIPTDGPPYVGVRSHDDRSTSDPDHGTVILGPDGERVLHWVENDFADPDGGRQAFVLRPALSLEPNTRYTVAIRNLVDRDGDPIEAEPAFAALRDHRPTDIPQLLERKADVQALFKRLHEAGISRKELVLAFEFTTASDHGLTHQMLAMRDQGLAWLDAQTEQTFVVNPVPTQQNDCSVPGTRIWRAHEGTFTVPLFLETFPGAPPFFDLGEHTVDANDVPVQNGTKDDVPFTLSLPCQLHPEYGDASAPVHTLLLGHGIFGNGRGMVLGIPPAAAGLMDFWRSQGRDTRVWNYVAGATNWSGWSNDDFVWVGAGIIGLFSSNLHRFPAFPDRHRQGQLNTLILSRMMKRGLFNGDPVFQDSLGNGLLPVPESDPDSGHYYYGISMGGVQGLFHAAISTDIEKFGIDVGSMNFSFLLPRSTQFNRPGDPFSFRARLAAIGISDDLDVLVGVQLLHELWVSADPAGYMTHVTDAGNLLPGNAFPKKLYLSPAWLDYQVSNHGTEMTTRTLGVTSGPGSLQKGLVGIPDEAPGTALDSALVMWDTGLHDVLDPADAEHFPPLVATVVESPDGDPHGARPFIPATIQTLMEFLQPGGRIENFCDDDGLCDASQAWECDSGVCP